MAWTPSLQDSIVLGMLGAAVLYTFLVTVIPHLMVKFVSIPYIDQPQQQVGGSGLQFQVILASVYHYHLSTKIVHFTLVFVDYCCWFICLHGCFGWWGVYVLSGLLFLQNLSYRNWYFITVTVIEASIVALLETQFLVHVISLETAYAWAPYVILADAGLRVVSHTIESMPPLVFGSDYTNFLSPPSIVLAIKKMCCQCNASCWLAVVEYTVVAFAGFISEIQNGFPLRLFPAFTYVILHDIYLGILADFEWSPKVAEHVRSIHENGFDGWVVTEEMYAWVHKSGAASPASGSSSPGKGKSSHAPLTVAAQP